MSDAVLQMFSERARQAVTLAEREARALHNRSVAASHLLLGLADLDSGDVAALLRRTLDVEALRARLETDAHEGELEADLAFHPSAKLALERAVASARDFGLDHVSAGNLGIGALAALPQEDLALAAAVPDLSALSRGLEECVRRGSSASPDR